MLQRRAIVVLMLVFASLGAMFVQAQGSALDGPTNEPGPLVGSQCFSCHEIGGGSLGPPLAVMYLMHAPQEVKIPIGEKADYNLQVENGWTSDLLDIVGAMDITNAPGLAFASDRDPETFDAQGVVAATANFVDRRDLVPFEVESGATQLTINVAGTGSPTQAANPPDFALHLWAPGSNTDSQPDIIHDESTDTTETFSITGGQAIAEFGIGTWTAGIVVPAPGPGSSAGAVDQPYVFSAVTSFDATETIQFIGSPHILAPRDDAPGARADVQWILRATEMPPETTITATVDVTSFYDHGSPSISAFDYWRYTKTVDLQVVPLPDENAVAIRSSTVQVLPDVQAGLPWDIISEVVGYVSSFLIVASIYTGGMFGKASRRQLNAVFGTAKRRVAFHNALSYAILVAALAHMIIFLFEAAFAWTLGIIWGGIAILAMVGLGVTGALQVPMIRRWNYATWRWSHFYLTIAVMVFTVVHIFLDGVHFTDFQSSIGWSDPFQ